MEAALAPFLYAAIIALQGWILHTLNTVLVAIGKIETRIEALEQQPKGKNKR